MKAAQFNAALLMRRNTSVGNYQIISAYLSRKRPAELCGHWVRVSSCCVDEDVTHHVHRHPRTPTRLCFLSHPALNDHDLKVSKGCR